MVRPNTILPVGANEQRPDYEFSEGVTFHIFELQDGAVLTSRVPAMNGETGLTLEASRRGQEIHIKAAGGAKSWQVLLRGISQVQAIQGCTIVDEENRQGKLLLPAVGAQELTVSIE